MYVDTVTIIDQRTCSVLLSFFIIRHKGST